LLEGFTSFRFEYLPREEMDLGWADKWDARDEEPLPAAVRVTVEGLPFFGGSVGQEIPLFTMALGWGTDEFQEPPDEQNEEDDSDESGGTTPNEDDDDGTTTTAEAANDVASTSSEGERGIALLMVIWIFMVLSVLSAEFSRHARRLDRDPEPRRGDSSPRRRARRPESRHLPPAA
jgi:hypothetical protein